MIVILGAGLAGLSASYHLGHDRCLILERSAHPFGLVKSERRDGCTWDNGPHVSFTKNDYVRKLFEKELGGSYGDMEVKVGNYYRGHWIDHPAQTSMYQLPKPVRDACLASFLATRKAVDSGRFAAVTDYQEWLERALGPVFADTFSLVYTLKYWTRAARDLSIDWIGGRVLYPEVDDVLRGAMGPLDRSTHYITRVRYPQIGGYQSFAEGLRRGSRIRYGADVVSIDLQRREVGLADGSSVMFDKLINTLPLPIFVEACRAVPAHVADAARALSCTQLLLVNVAAPHRCLRPEHWLYVYDAEKLSTRINFTESLSTNNAPDGWTGVQTEVYFSRHRPLPCEPEEVSERVEAELIEMGIIDPARFPTGKSSHRHIKHVPWANVIFDHNTAPSLDLIWSWLETHGLIREADDLHPLTNWATSLPSAHRNPASLFMAGRFGQWKYYWTDDCVLRGKRISELLAG